MSNHRDRKYLDLAHRVTLCQRCQQWTDGCEPAHSNQQKHGKGASLKAHDVFHAALCHDCHVFIDAGRERREEAQADWQDAFERTLLLYFKNGWLKVAR